MKFIIDFTKRCLVSILLWERKTYLKKRIVQIVKFAFSTLVVWKKLIEFSICENS